MIEIPRRQFASLQKFLRLKLEIGPTDDSMIVGQERTHRTAKIPRTSLERKDCHDASGIFNHGHFYIFASSGYNSRKLGSKVWTLESHILPLQLRPAFPDFTMNTRTRINDCRAQCTTK